MKKQLIQEVQRQMLPFLNNAQLKQLQSVLEGVLSGVELSYSAGMVESAKVDTVVCFINAKRIEGCSEKTLSYYRQTIVSMLSGIDKEPQEIVTEDLRKYLTEYQTNRKSSKVTIDNIRRILSSYFSWLEDEDYIVKSPVRRIHKVKTAKVIKETYTDEALEIMRDNCCNVRDLAMIDLLASSGMRVGEMVALNRDDINFNERECVVFGKGSKERIVYFDARTKIHLQNYLESRTDTCSALLVSLTAPHDRLQIGGVERRLRELGKRLNLPRVHPHYGAVSIVDYVDDYIFDGEYLLLSEDGIYVVDDSGHPLLQHIIGKFWANNHAHILKGKAGFTEDSLYLFLSNTNMSPIVTGAAQPKINQANLKSFPITIPDSEVLDRFNSVVHPLFAGKLNNEKEIRKLETIRELLLSRLVS